MAILRQLQSLDRDKGGQSEARRQRGMGLSTRVRRARPLWPRGGGVVLVVEMSCGVKPIDRGMLVGLTAT